MQRIFTTFPNGWPGTGLLILRIAAGAPLIIAASAAFSGPPAAGLPWLALVSIVSASLLISGFLTPVASASQMSIELWLAFAGATFQGDHVIRAMIGISLIMLGPGSWSNDARIYGRKRIDF